MEDGWAFQLVFDLNLYVNQYWRAEGTINL